MECVCPNSQHLKPLLVTSAQKNFGNTRKSDSFPSIVSCYIQWNLSNTDTNGTEEGVVVSEVSSFQRLKCMQEWYLGWEKASCLERCPQFRGVLIERDSGSTVHTIR